MCQKPDLLLVFARHMQNLVTESAAKYFSTSSKSDNSSSTIGSGVDESKILKVLKINRLFLKTLC